MKSKHILIFLFLSSTSSFGQVVKYNFETKEFQDDTLNYGKMGSLQVSNINLFANKLTIQGEPYTFDSEELKEFQALFSQEAENASEKAIETGKGVAGVATIAQIDSDRKGQIMSLAKECEDYAKSIRDLSYVNSILSDLICLSENDKINTSVEMAQEIKKLKIDERIEKGKVVYEKFESQYHKIEKNYSNMKTLASDSNITTLGNVLSLAEPKIKEDYKELEVLYDSLVCKTRNFLIELKDNSSFTATSEPISVKGDEIQFTLNLKKGKEEAKELDPIIIPVVGGWKVDFSTGPALNFGKGARDTEVFFTNPTDTTQRINSTLSSNIMKPTLMAQMHVTHRSKKTLEFGFVFGLSSGFESLSTIDLGFLSGLGFAIGKKEKRVFATAGVSFNQVNRLKPKFEIESEKIVKKDSVELENLVQKVYKPAGYFSITYVLRSRNKM